MSLFEKHLVAHQVLVEVGTELGEEAGGEAHLDGMPAFVSTINSILEWIQGNYGYANILMAVFIAIWIKVFFRKYGYNFFEILVLLCYVMGIVMLLYTVFGVIESLTDLRVLQFGGIIGFMYISWAIGQFFDKRRKLNYFKGLLSYILGMISFFLVVIFVGMGIDFLQKML